MKYFGEASIKNSVAAQKVLDEYKERPKLVVEKVTSANNARDEICRCEHGGSWRELPKIIHCTPVNYCGNCGGKLSPIA